MVRYTEKTCLSHSVSGNVYNCEKFYGNWAKEVYQHGWTQAGVIAHGRPLPSAHTSRT